MNNSEETLDIFIVNWNSGNYLFECLNSLRKYTANIKIKLHIYVIDNNSSDNSCNIILQNNEHLIRLPKNVGFGEANNVAFKSSNSNYILLLNPDTRFIEDCITPSIAYLKSDSDLACISVQQRYPNGTILKSCGKFPNFMAWVYEIVGLSKVFPFLFCPVTIMSNWDHASSSYVDHVMGSFMLLKRDIIQKIELFDKSYFMYFEDFELSKRIKDNGYKTYFLADIKIIHEGCGTSKNIKGKRLFYNINSRLIYIKKYHTRLEYIILKLLTFLIEPMSRMIQLILFGRLKEIRELFKAYKMLYSGQKPN